MEEVLLLKCGELVLKGLNRGKFEERLLKIIRNRLRPVGEYHVHSSQSTIYVEPQNGASVDEALEVCKRIFGIVAIARAVVCEKDIEDIVAKGIPYLKSALDNVRTFKVETRRADKRFALTSPQISQRLGGDLHDAYPHLKAQMDDPQITVKVEVRERNAFVSAGVIPGAGGLPTGINGRGMLLLSGGIDSPVAGWMMAKRGLELGAVHFFSYPYTSEEAKQKVLDLAEIVARWSGKLTVSVVPFTKIQTEIRDKCPEDYFTIIMRRMMMRIAERVAEKQNCQGLITGESLGQVASQTIDALCCTDAVADMPVFRPLIGSDKIEIIRIAEKIGTYETSCQPYEDCCTVFTPRHPATHPKMDHVARAEQCLDIEALVSAAVEGTEVIEL